MHPDVCINDDDYSDVQQLAKCLERYFAKSHIGSVFCLSSPQKTLVNYIYLMCCMYRKQRRHRCNITRALCICEHCGINCLKYKAGTSLFKPVNFQTCWSLAKMAYAAGDAGQAATICISMMYMLDMLHAACEWVHS